MSSDNSSDRKRFVGQSVSHWALIARRLLIDYGFKELLARALVRAPERMQEVCSLNGVYFNSDKTFSSRDHFLVEQGVNELW